MHQISSDEDSDANSDKEEEEMISHVFSEVDHWSQSGSSQHDFQEMLKDKNFVQSKIRNDFKAEYDLLN